MLWIFFFSFFRRKIGLAISEFACRLMWFWNKFIYKGFKVGSLDFGKDEQFESLDFFYFLFIFSVSVVATRFGFLYGHFGWVWNLASRDDNVFSQHIRRSFSICTLCFTVKPVYQPKVDFFTTISCSLVSFFLVWTSLGWLSLSIRPNQIFHNYFLLFCIIFLAWILWLN